MTESKFLTIEEVLALTGQKRPTFYHRRARGRFPQPVKVGRREVAYPRAVVDAWIAKYGSDNDVFFAPGPKPRRHRDP